MNTWFPSAGAQNKPTALPAPYFAAYAKGTVPVSSGGNTGLINCELTDGAFDWSEHAAVVWGGDSAQR